MKREEVKYILKKNARVIYSNDTNIYDEIQRIKPFLHMFHGGYDLFADAILASATSNHVESLNICNKSLDFAFQHNDIELIQELSMFMGIINRSIGRRDEALKNYLTALKYDRNPRCYNNIADIYLLYGEYEEARKYLIKALDLLDEDETLSDFGRRLLNTIYTNLSEAEIKAGKLDAGIASAHKCIENAEVHNDLYAKASAHYLLALAHSRKGAYDKALNFLEISQQLYINCDTYSRSRVFDYIEENTRLKADILSQWGKYQASIDCIKTLHAYRKSDYQLLLANSENLEDDAMTFKYYKAFMTYLREEEVKDTDNRINYLKSQVRIFDTEKKANDYELLYNHTKSIASIGKDIIASEKLDDVMVALHSQIDRIMDFDSLLLAVVDKGQVNYNWVMDNNKLCEPFSVAVEDENSFSSWVVRNNKALRINDAMTEDEITQYKKDYKPNVYGRAMDALLICPIAYKDTIYGLLNVQSLNSYSYTEYDLEVLNMLASFIAVAMKNWKDTKALLSLNNRLKHLSKTDALTGINNRHVLSEIVEDLFSKDDSEDTISVVMIDIDYFKEYNDTYGHIEGDRCLIQLVDAMKPYLNENGNRLFRYGGDEFSAILPNMTPKAVEVLLEEVRADIEALKIDHSQSKISNYVTCSFGFTTVKKGSEYQRAFYLADEALYMSKANHKNCISYKKE